MKNEKQKSEKRLVKNKALLAAMRKQQKELREARECLFVAELAMTAMKIEIARASGACDRLSGELSASNEERQKLNDENEELRLRIADMEANYQRVACAVRTIADVVESPLVTG